MRIATTLVVILAATVARSASSPGGKSRMPAAPPLDSTDPLALLESRIPVQRADWARMEAGVYYAHNNVWNKAGVSRYRQAVGARLLADGAVEAGWAWQWPQSNRAMAFPELVVGRNPWAAASTHPRLPAMLQDLRALSVEMDVEHQGWGARGTAIQIWLTGDSLAGPDKIRHELMIWVANEGIPPKGWMADVVVDGAAYTLTDDPDLGMELKWTCFSFFRAAPLARGRLDLLPFFEYLERKGLIDRREWVASVHLGTEVRGGSGLTRVKRFALEVSSKSTGAQ